MVAEEEEYESMETAIPMAPPPASTAQKTAKDDDIKMWAVSVSRINRSLACNICSLADFLGARCKEEEEEGYTWDWQFITVLCKRIRQGSCAEDQRTVNYRTYS